MGRSASSFNRRPPRYKPQPTILVICEDVKSGRRYIEDATRHFRVHVTVVVSHCGKTDPKGIVEDAIARQKDYDRVFCVLDRDTHPSFDAAVRMAGEHVKIDLIVSYPCLEFWYLLHFGFSRAPYMAAGGKSAGECLLADLRKREGMAEYAKGGDASPFESLLPRLPDARRVSLRVLEQAKEEGNYNPSTRIHELIEFFEKLANPQPA